MRPRSARVPSGLDWPCDAAKWQRSQPRTDFGTPPALTSVGRERETGRACNNVIEGRQKAIFAIVEQVIERASRHPRPISHPRHGHLPVPILRHDRHGRAQHPRALRLRQLHTPTPRGHPRRSAPTTPAHRPLTRHRHHAIPPGPANARGNPTGPKGPKTGRDPALRPAVSAEQRERERERCVSDADASSYGPLRARNDPQHRCPYRTHANTTPHHHDQALSPTIPCYKRLKPINRQPAQTRPITRHPTQRDTSCL